MGFLLDAVIEGMKMIVVVSIVYAILNEPMQVTLLPMLDTTAYPQVADLKSILVWVWSNWGTLTIIGAVIYAVVAALRRSDTYAPYG